VAAAVVPPLVIEPRLDAFTDRVAADSIVNRLANNARTINLGDVDMRRQRQNQARQADSYWE